MAIIGIESLVYAVEDLDACTRFFTDFGLIPTDRNDESSRFVLPEGSSVVLRRLGDRALLPTVLRGLGVHEVIWGVDRQNALDQMAANLASDRAGAPR